MILAPTANISHKLVFGKANIIPDLGEFKFLKPDDNMGCFKPTNI